MLLERDGLLAGLRDRLDQARDGHGSMVLVAGEAGSGKTSLVQSFIEALDDSTLVILGACDLLATPRPMGPLHDFAADPDSGMSGLTSGDKTAIEMSAEVLERLTNTIRPIVMVIEDVHWADEGTLDFLRFIGRRVADAKAVVICTYRDDEVGTDHPLRPVLGQLNPLSSTHRLAVPALSLEAVSVLARDHPVDPRELLELTDGNPFFVTEVLASGEDLPDTVQGAVLARVAQLDDDSRRVVEAVSVAPRSMDVGQAARISGNSLEHVDSALAAGVLVGDGGELRFRHELARSAVEDSLPPARRLRFHQRMLDLLLEANSDDLARLAHHSIGANASEQIVEFAPAAAREARTRNAHKEAVEFYRAALAHEDLIDGDEAAEMRVELAAELGTIDRPGEAVSTIDLAVEHYRKTGNELALAATLIPQTRSRWRFEDAGRFQDSLDEAFSILEKYGASPDLAQAYFTSAYHNMLARHGDQAARDIEKARSMAAEANAGELTWMIDMIDGCIHVVLGDPDAGIAMLEESARSAIAADRFDQEVLALSMLGSAGGEVRRYETAIPALEACVEKGLAVDQDYQVAYSRSWLARIALEQGRWDDAVEYATLVDRATFHRKGISIITGLSALGRVRVRRGDPGGLALLDEMVELSRTHELQHSWNAYCGRAEYFWLSGQPERGLDELEPAMQRALDTDSAWARGEIGFWMWRVGAIDGPPEGSAEPFALQMSGNWREAAAAWGEIGCPYEVGLALADGDSEAMLEAVRIFDSLGAGPMAGRTRSALRDAGVGSIPRGPTRSTRDNPSGLTARQMEVLDMIARGKTNSEIADELFLSAKTVEHHVSAILTKLGVANRTEAAALVSQI